MMLVVSVGTHQQLLGVSWMTQSACVCTQTMVSTQITPVPNAAPCARSSSRDLSVRSVSFLRFSFLIGFRFMALSFGVGIRTRRESRKRATPLTRAPGMVNADPPPLRRSLSYPAGQGRCLRGSANATAEPAASTLASGSGYDGTGWRVTEQTAGRGWRLWWVAVAGALALGIAWAWVCP